MSSVWEAVIGLEVHAQLQTRTKLFCRCANTFGQEGNRNTCPVCLGLPGALPVLNRQAVELAARASLALEAKVEDCSIFARKNYFYPDLPKGYQISQFDRPLATGGCVSQVKLTRIHMEEDAGKLLHSEEASLVDLNRAGVPLIEIVSEPELHSGEEAATYLKTLRKILRYVGASLANMEEGQLRCDANISVRKVGAAELGTKVEIKNMNSFRHVERALDYEIERQPEVLEDGGSVTQETRLWQEDRGVTLPMRGKEYAHDYRYLPEPDLRPLRVDSAWIESVRSDLPELPGARHARFKTEYQLTDSAADLLTSEKELADYFEDTLGAWEDPSPDRAKQTANLITGELMRLANNRRLSIPELSITPNQVADLLALLESQEVSRAMAKDILAEMVKTGQEARDIIRANKWGQISDSDELRALVQKILQENPKQVEQFRAGKEKVWGFLVGKVMQASRGQANPKLVNELLKEELANGV